MDNERGAIVKSIRQDFYDQVVEQCSLLRLPQPHNFRNTIILEPNELPSGYFSKGGSSCFCTPVLAIYSSVVRTRNTVDERIVPAIYIEPMGFQKNYSIQSSPQQALHYNREKLSIHINIIMSAEKGPQDPSTDTEKVQSRHEQIFGAWDDLEIVLSEEKFSEPNDVIINNILLSKSMIDPDCYGTKDIWLMSILEIDYQFPFIYNG